MRVHSPEFRYIYINPNKVSSDGRWDRPARKFLKIRPAIILELAGGNTYVLRVIANGFGSTLTSFSGPRRATSAGGVVGGGFRNRIEPRQPACVRDGAGFVLGARRGESEPVAIADGNGIAQSTADGASRNPAVNTQQRTNRRRSNGQWHLQFPIEPQTPLNSSEAQVKLTSWPGLAGWMRLEARSTAKGSKFTWSTS